MGAIPFDPHNDTPHVSLRAAADRSLCGLAMIFILMLLIIFIVERLVDYYY